MAFEMSDEMQVVHVYNVTNDTFAFVDEADVQIPPHTGLPALCTIVAPPDVIPEGQMAIFNFELEEWTLVDYPDEAMMEAAIMPLSLEMEEPEPVEPSAEQLMIAEQEAKLIEAQNRIAELEEQVASLQRVNDLEKNLEELTRMVEKLRNKEE